jgi:hypothetical protein
MIVNYKDLSHIRFAAETEGTSKQIVTAELLNNRLSTLETLVLQNSIEIFEGIHRSDIYETRRRRVK